MIAYAIPGSSGVLYTLAAPNVAEVVGYTIREAAGTPGLASFNLREATSAGKIILTVSLLASTSQTHSLNFPLICNGAVYCEIVAGTVVGAIWIK